MYSAEDVRRRIEEKKKETVANQLIIVSNRTERMFTHAISEDTFTTVEALLIETLSQVREYGFNIRMVKKTDVGFEYIISVPEEKNDNE